MSRIIQRVLALLAIVGCGIWIGKSSQEVEPYVTAIGAIAAFLALFNEREEPAILLSLVSRQGCLTLFIRNIGDADAFDVEVHKGPETECFFCDCWGEFNGGLRLESLHRGQAITVEGYLSKEGRMGKIGHFFEWSWTAKKGGKRFSRQGRVSVEIESLPQAPPPTHSSTAMDASAGRSTLR